MKGYVESLTDPSYRNQLLFIHWKKAARMKLTRYALNYESEKINALAVVASKYCDESSHWNAVKSLAKWLNESKVPEIFCMTRDSLPSSCVKKRSILAQLFLSVQKIPWVESQHFGDPKLLNLVVLVWTKKPRVFNKGGEIKLAAIDFGIKYNQVWILCQLGAEVHVLPCGLAQMVSQFAKRAS